MRTGCSSGGARRAVTVIIVTTVIMLVATHQAAHDASALRVIVVSGVVMSTVVIGARVCRGYARVSRGDARVSVGRGTAVRVTIGSAVDISVPVFAEQTAHHTATASTRVVTVSSIVVARTASARRKRVTGVAATV